MIDFYGLNRGDLEELLSKELGAPKYRAQQLFNWIYRRRITDLLLMTDIGQQSREQLKSLLSFRPTEYAQREVSSDGTRKYLVKVDNDDLVEAVMIKQPTRMTLCVSSQVGCGMGCAFCRTATMGFKRHLSSGEIIQQVLTVIEDAQHFGDMFSNVVFMGMGEPLHNFEGIARAIDVLTDPFALSIAPRKITVSTVGLVPMIKKFPGRVNANIAVSLNATDNEVRSQIMPMNKAYPIEELLGALREYPSDKRKQITIEYVMLSGVNDRPEDLSRLPKLLKGIQAKVNLIPYNENAGLGFKSPSRDWISTWQNQLKSKGLEVTVRWSKGQDISAACGQLATASVRGASVSRSIREQAITQG